MSNLSEDIINKYLTGQCTEEELIEVNAWMKESEENALQLFRMEEIYHLGKFNQYADGQRMARAEKQLYRKLDEEKGKQNKILRMHRWMRYAVAIAAILVIGGGAGYYLTILAKMQVYSIFSSKLSLSFTPKILSLSQTKRKIGCLTHFHSIRIPFCK